MCKKIHGIHSEERRAKRFCFNTKPKRMDLLRRLTPAYFCLTIQFWQHDEMSRQTKHLLDSRRALKFNNSRPFFERRALPYRNLLSLLSQNSCLRINRCTALWCETAISLPHTPLPENEKRTARQNIIRWYYWRDPRER